MLNRKGQNIAEYSILIAIVIAAAVAMQVYVKRGIQGRIADAVDHAPLITVADNHDTITYNFSTRQYEPYYTNNVGQVESSRDYTENIVERGKIDRTGLNEETKKLTGAYEKSEWANETAR